MTKLYEIRIYEPAVTDGLLFLRPERWRYTNAYQFGADTEEGKPLRPVGGQSDWWFVDGLAEVYDFGTNAMTQAEIVGEIDGARAMEKDRFVFVERGFDEN